MNVSDMICMYP